MVLYRVENFLQSTGYDEAGDCSTGSEVKVAIHAYEVIKETPKGYWVSFNMGGSWKRFVLKDGKKRFAYETKEAAIKAFRLRKFRQIDILTTQLKHAKQAVELPESSYIDCTTNLS